MKFICVHVWVLALHAPPACGLPQNPPAAWHSACVPAAAFVLLHMEAAPVAHSNSLASAPMPRA